MANDKRTAEVILKYSVDRASIAQAERSAEQVKRSQEGIKAEFTKLGVSAANGVKRVRSELGDLERNIQREAREVIDFRRELERLDSVRVSPTVEVKRGGSGGRALDQLDRIGSVGSQVLGGLDQAGAANAAGLLGDVAGGLANLNPVGIAATAAMAGLALVIGNAQAETQRLTEATLARLNAEREAYRFAATATRDQLTAQIVDVREQIRVEEEILALRGQEVEEITATTSALDELRATLGLGFGELAAADQAFAEQNKVVQDLWTQYETLTERLSVNATATNDANAAVEEAAANALATMAEAERISEESVRVTARLQLEAQRAAAERIASVPQAFLSGAQDAISTARDLQASYQKVADAQAALDKLNTDFAAQQDKINADLAKREADIAREGNDRLLAIAEDYGIDAAEAQEDLKRELLRIQRSANLEQLNAIGERDALAHFLAEQEAKAQQREAKEDADVEAKRRKAAYDRQLRDLAKSLDDQYRKARDAANEQLRLADQRYRAELQQRQQALTAAQTQHQQYFTNVLDIGARGYTAAISQFTGFIRGIQNTILSGASGGSAQQGITSGISSGGGEAVYRQQISGRATPLASGMSYVPYDNFPALLHKGERVLTAAQNRVSGRNIVVNVTGDTVDSIVREVSEKLRVALAPLMPRGGAL